MAMRDEGGGAARLAEEAAAQPTAGRRRQVVNGAQRLFAAAGRFVRHPSCA
jgi:hypothetical protein